MASPARRWCIAIKEAYGKLSKDVIQEMRSNPKELNKIPGSEGDEKGMRYGVIHQLAFYRNHESLKELVDEFGLELDLSLLSDHGDCILSIGRHKGSFTEFLVKARELMEKQLEEVLQQDQYDTERVHRFLLALRPGVRTVFRSLMVNVPVCGAPVEAGEYGFGAACPTAAGQFMKTCLERAVENGGFENGNTNQKGTAFSVKWLFAQEPGDEIVEQATDWVRSLLPVHGTSPVAFAQMMVSTGGSLVGLKGFEEFGQIPDYGDGGNPLKGSDAFEEFVSRALYDLDPVLYQTTTAHDIEPERRVFFGGFLRHALVAKLGDRDLLPKDVPSGIVAATGKEAASRFEVIKEQMIAETAKAGDGSLRTSLDPHSEMKRLVDDQLNNLVLVLHSYVEIIQGDNKPGLKVVTDVCLGTDNHLFAVLGANVSYGDVWCAFKPEVLRSPDAEMTPHCTTAYLGKNHIVARRPWVAAGLQGALPGGVRIPDAKTTGWGFDPDKLNEYGDYAEEATDLCGKPKLSCYQAVALRKLNQLHATLTPEVARRIAEEIVASARSVLTGVRSPFPGRKGKTVASELHAVQKADALSAADCTLQRISEYYDALERHACVEVHLPRAMPPEAIEHVFISIEALETMKQSAEESVCRQGLNRLLAGVKLADGRMLKVKEVGGRFEADCETATVCKKEAAFKAQQDFFANRLHKLKQMRDQEAAASEGGMRDRLRCLPHATLAFDKVAEEGLEFRLGAYLNHRPMYLPPVHGDQFEKGIAVTFETNTTFQVEVFFTDHPNRPARYAIELGRFRNTSTRVGRWQGSGSSWTLAGKDEVHGSLPSLLACTDDENPNLGGKWTRYMVALSYTRAPNRAGACFFFARLGTSDKPEELAVAFRLDGRKLKRGSDCDPAVQLPALFDEAAITDVRFVGFSCLKIGASIRRCRLHAAPTVSLLG